MVYETTRDRRESRIRRKGLKSEYINQIANIERTFESNVLSIIISHLVLLWFQLQL